MSIISIVHSYMSDAERATVEDIVKDTGFERKSVARALWSLAERKEVHNRFNAKWGHRDFGKDVRQDGSLVFFYGNGRFF